MLPAVEALLTQIVDYAGLFPPAKLPLDVALRNYLSYRRTSPHRWMLGRFVCPTARLGEVRALIDAPEDAALLRITALARQSSSTDQLLPQLDADLHAILAFRQAWGDPSVVDVLEWTLPRDGSAELLDRLMPTALSNLRQSLLHAYLEVPTGLDGNASVEKLADTLSALQTDEAAPTLGLKLRCGGVTADAFPTEEQIARFIVCCRDRRLPWKATAGLHHPHRTWDASLQVWHHGFLNVFGAGVLAEYLPLREADLVDILADREGRHFRFDASGLTWKDRTCPVAEIARIRGSRLASFGSCSFEEPCQDLLALGWLQE